MFTELAQCPSVNDERGWRMHDYIRHEVRNGWLFYDDTTQGQLRALGWEPPRPARRPGPDGKPETILDNFSGEDFLYTQFCLTNRMAASGMPPAQSVTVC